MNRHLAAGLVLCGSFVLVAGAVRQPEMRRGAPPTDDEALIMNVEVYAECQGEALNKLAVHWQAGKIKMMDLIAAKRVGFESRILLARITEDQEGLEIELTELVEYDTMMLERAVVEGRLTGEFTNEMKLELTARLARSSFQLWEHRRELEESK